MCWRSAEPVWSWFPPSEPDTNRTNKITKYSAMLKTIPTLRLLPDVMRLLFVLLLFGSDSFCD